MLTWVRDGLRLFLHNIPLLFVVVLTIQLPCNLILEYVDRFVWNDSELRKSFQLATLSHGILSPFVDAATIFALMRRREGRRVSWWECLAAGLRNWLGLFAANLVSGLQILFGLLVIIPGIQFWIRYSMLPFVVVLEGRGGKDARQRSWDLTQGRSLAIVFVSVGISVLWFVLFVLGSLSIDWLLEVEIIDLNGFFALTVLVSCFADCLFVALTAVLFAAYWDLSGRGSVAMTVDAVEEGPATLWPKRADDGNPYRAPWG